MPEHKAIEPYTRGGAIWGFCVWGMFVLWFMAGCTPATTAVRGPALLGSYLNPEGWTGEQVAEVLGDLSDRDAIRADGQYMDRYLLFGHQNEELSIRLESSEIDSYLLLFDTAGVLVAEDDDSGSGLNSAIDIRLPADGIYWVVASSYRRQEGRYHLRVTGAAYRAEYSVLKWPASLQGVFHRSTPMDANGCPFRIHALELEAGRTIHLGVTSTSLHPRVRLYDEGGWEITLQSDQDETFGSWNSYTPPSDGLYFLVVTTYAPVWDWDLAEYQLRIEE